MTTRRRRGAGATPEILLTCVAILVAAAWFVRDHPVILAPPDDPGQRALIPESAADADVLIVIPVVPEADARSDLSWDQVWLNTVEQEIGRARIVDSNALTRSAMDPCDWVIIPRTAASQLDPTQTQFVRNWVEDGGVLLLEQPEGPWQPLTGQAFTGARARDARRMTGFDGAVSRGELREDVLDMPMRTSLFTYNPATFSRGRDYHVLMEIDGQPGIIRVPLGRGSAFVVLFDMGRLVGTMQQGLLDEDLTVRDSRVGAAAGLALTADLVADDALFTSDVPWADLLERNVLYLLDTAHPVGRLWLYPSSRRGALVATHSEAGFGDRADFMTRWERSTEERASMFAVVGSMDPEALARVSRLGADVQLQWIPADIVGAPVRTWGLRGFRPVHRAMTLVEQRRGLDDDLNPYGPTLATRTVDGLWAANAGDMFRSLEAAGIALDTSYGPAPAWVAPDRAQIGYLFGTGYAFRPVDTNGNLLGLRELPFHWSDGAIGYDVATVRRLIVESAEGYHTTLVGDWRPDTMSRRPSFDALEAWRSAFDLARSQDLWVTTVNEFAAFAERRAQSSVRSTFSREERRLTIEATVVGPDDPGEDLTALTPSVAFPARFDSRPVERLMVDGFTVDVADLALTGDRALHVVPLEPGEHRVQVFYASPIDLEEEPTD